MSPAPTFQDFWTLPISDLFHSDWNQVVRSPFHCQNLQDIHNKNFLSSGLFKVVHQGWWTLQLINHVKAFRLQKVPKTVQHHGKFGKRLSFTFGESCQSGLKSLKAALPMILEKIKLDLSISGLDSGYIFDILANLCQEGMQWIELDCRYIEEPLYK